MFFLKLFINKLKNICKIQSGTFVSDTNGTFHSVTSAITKLFSAVFIKLQIT